MGEVDVGRAFGSTPGPATARSIPGTLRQEVLIDGQHRLITDEPESVGGDGSAPSPHELLPAALAACISTTLVMYARAKEWELGDVIVDVDYDHRSTPRRFAVSVTVGGDLGDAQLERLRKVASACPVARSLESGFEFVETLERATLPLGRLSRAAAGPLRARGRQQRALRPTPSSNRRAGTRRRPA